MGMSVTYATDGRPQYAGRLPAGIGRDQSNEWHARAQRWREAFEMRANGMPAVDIAGELGVSVKTVYNWCDKWLQLVPLEKTNEMLLQDSIRYDKIIRGNLQQASSGSPAHGGIVLQAMAGKQKLFGTQAADRRAGAQAEMEAEAGRRVAMVLRTVLTASSLGAGEVDSIINSFVAMMGAQTETVTIVVDDDGEQVPDFDPTIAAQILERDAEDEHDQLLAELSGD